MQNVTFKNNPSEFKDAYCPMLPYVFQSLISSTEDDDDENLGAMAKYKLNKAITPEKKALLRAKEKKGKDKAAMKLEKQRKKDRTAAAKKKEVAKADKLARTQERELKKKEMLKVQQSALAAQRQLQKAAAKVCGLEPTKRRGRPPKNLAAAMEAADSAAAASAKQVIDSHNQVTIFGSENRSSTIEIKWIH